MQKLNAESLTTWKGDVPVPSYPRDPANVGIVHFGVGGFHRAHQAMYLDRLMSDGKALEWGICGVGVLPHDKRMSEVMAAQNGLYTLIVKHPDGHREPRVIGSIFDYLFAPADPEAVIEKMASAQIKIVSLTVTEGGYNLHNVTGEFDQSNPDVVHDLQDGAVPKTTFGLVTEALRRRRDRGLAPFTVMSCDNIQGNGEVAKKMFTAYALLKDPELAAWVQQEVHFPNSMVDRITPATTDEDRAEVAEHFDIEDGWPVVCEPFIQWVLEDSFTAGRPAFDEVGVQVVEDVEPYELMKLRLLNASHQAMCYFGYLAGYRYAHEIAQDTVFADFLLAYMEKEGTPTLEAVPGVDLENYRRTLIDRLSNEHVRDAVARLCADTSDRIPKFLVPVIHHNLASDGEISRSAGVIASWARYAEGVDEQGEPIEIIDRLKDTLMANAAKQKDDPNAFIANRELFGDLVDNERFVAAYQSALSSLRQNGARATVKSLI